MLSHCTEFESLNILFRLTAAEQSKKSTGCFIREIDAHSELDPLLYDSLG